MSNNELNVLLARLESLLSQTRQYVGARYVPRFTGLFDITQSYEALDVVDNGSGTSYIAKKPTPAGTPLTDTNYWFLYGSTNGAIVNLQQQINDMKNGDVPGSLQEQINENTSDITALRNHFGSLVDATMKFVFIGDSYNNPDYGGWGDKIASYLGIASSDYASIHMDGGAFYDGAMLTGINNYAATLTADERLEVGNVVCLGGINDATPNITNWDTQLGGAIATWVTRVKELFPNARVSIGFIGNSRPNSAILMGRDYENIMRAIQQYSYASVKNGANYIPNLEYILHDYFLMGSDGIHPTLNGGDTIGLYGASALVGHHVEIKKYSHYTSANLSSFWNTSNHVGSHSVLILAPQGESDYFADIYRDNGVTTFTLGGRIGIIAGAGTPFSVSIGSTWECGKIASVLLQGKRGLTIPVSCGLRHSDNSTAYNSATGVLLFVDGNVDLRIDAIDGGWTHLAVSTDQIVIEPISFSFPTLLA